MGSTESRVLSVPVLRRRSDSSTERHGSQEEADVVAGTGVVCFVDADVVADQGTDQGEDEGETMQYAGPETGHIAARVCADHRVGAGPKPHRDRKNADNEEKDTAANGNRASNAITHVVPPNTQMRVKLPSGI
jgi:hypothetical protein